MEAGRFYRVVQHSGKVVPFSPPTGRPPLSAARQQLLNSSSNTRTMAQPASRSRTRGHW